MLRERNKGNKRVQGYKLSTGNKKNKMNSKPYDWEDVDPFLDTSTRRERICTTKEEKEKRARQCTCFTMQPSVL